MLDHRSDAERGRGPHADAAGLNHADASTKAVVADDLVLAIAAHIELLAEWAGRAMGRVICAETHGVVADDVVGSWAPK
jgi:hypothetical protein